MPGGILFIKARLVPCRFCGNVAVGKFVMSHGCVDFPNEREQDLCLMHVSLASPLGTMDIIEVHQPMYLEFLSSYKYEQAF
jgi:hypothetical protein